MLKAYWWNAGPPNFGDRLTGFLMMKLGVSPHWAPAADADVTIVGSILEHLPEGWTGTVCGAGLLRPESRVNLSSAKVVALRGKLTAARVTGKKGNPVLGDPGLLVSKFVNPPPAKYDLGIVPHWSDTELAKRFPQGKLIDVRAHPELVVQQIASCKRIISSSLHGLVVADAFGIPRQAERFERAAKEGGDFKFRDYASVFDGDPHFGEMWTAPFREVERIQEALLAVLTELLGLPPLPAFDAPEGRRRRWPFSRRPKISFLVPFRDDGEHRSRVWHWLHRYWSAHLPDAEIVMGHDGGSPFGKAAAVNDAASRARGKVFVVMDADAYMDPQVVQRCADEILKAKRRGRRIWFIPYRHLFRLREDITLDILEIEPEWDLDLPSPPPDNWVESHNSAHYGHLYGAMMQIMPREAFWMIGGWPSRFRGWGSEDAAAMRALDTMWAPHEVTHNDMLHFWHAREGDDVKTRKWVGQHTEGNANSRQAQRFAVATGEPAFMAALVQEHAPRRGWRKANA